MNPATARARRAAAAEPGLGAFDVIFPLNFGLPADLPANRAIAAAARRASRQAQRPIFYAPRAIFDFADAPDVHWRDFSGYVSTVKQVQALAAAAAQHDWRSVLVVAAPPHRWRVLRDLRAAGFQARADPALRALARRTWFAKASQHKQTTAWWRWWLTWEIPARMLLLACRRCYERRATR